MYEIILDNIIEGVFIANQNDIIYYVNEGMLKITGNTKDQIIGQNIFKDFLEENLNSLIPYYLKTKNDLRTTYFDEILKTSPSGQKSYLSGYLFPLLKNGTLNNVVCVIKALPKYKEIKNELVKKSNALDERIKELNCFYNLSKIIEKNELIFPQFLYDVVKIMPPAYQYPEIACARICLEGMNFKTDNFRETKWKQEADIYSSTEKLGTLEVYYLEEKHEFDEGPFLKEERALIDAISERLGRIIERLNLAKFPEENPNPILRSTAEKILYMNSASKNLFHTNLENELPDILQNDIQEAISKKISKESNFKINDKIFSFIITPIKDTEYANLYGRDVTAKVKAEEAYREAQKARQEKLNVLGQLAGGVGHELRNPLGAMKNAVYFLNLTLENPEPDVKEVLDVLSNEISNSEMIITSLLGFANPKPPILQKVVINEILQSILNNIIIPENIEVVKNFDDNLPIIVGDPFHLAHSFRNIIVNAFQAMLKGGTLILNTCLTNTGSIAVSFEDTGTGIKKENMDKLFEPLFTTKAKGIGLGLSISKLMIKNHGGSIDVISEEGKGTTFKIELPIHLRSEGFN